MHITIQNDASLPMRIPYQLLRIENCRMQKFIWRKPFAIQVTPKQTAPIIAIDDTIWIQHRHHFKNEMLPQFLS